MNKLLETVGVSDMQGFIHDIAALISLTTFVASVGVLSEVVRLVV